AKVVVGSCRGGGLARGRIRGAGFGGGGARGSPPRVSSAPHPAAESPVVGEVRAATVKPPRRGRWLTGGALPGDALRLPDSAFRVRGGFSSSESRRLSSGRECQPKRRSKAGGCPIAARLRGRVRRGLTREGESRGRRGPA